MTETKVSIDTPRSKAFVFKEFIHSSKLYTSAFTFKLKKIK